MKVRRSNVKNVAGGPRPVLVWRIECSLVCNARVFSSEARNEGQAYKIRKNLF